MAVRFTGAPVSYADFTSVVDAAGVGGFVERHKGHYQRFDFGDGVVAGTGKVTRFRALPAFMTFAAEHGLTPESIDEHFNRQAPKLPKQVLVLRGIVIEAGPQQVQG